MAFIDGRRIYLLASVSGLKEWTDYIPVAAGGAGRASSFDYTGYEVPSEVLTSVAGLVAWRDYIPVYEVTGRTKPWSTDAAGYMPADYGEGGGGGDVTAPTLSSPTDAANGSTGGTLGVTTNEGNGTLYWVVTTSATSPSAAQVQAGQTHTGATATAAGSQAVSGTGAIAGIAATGLTAGTAYYAHFCQVDAATNVSTVVSADGFTTAAASTTTFLLIPGVGIIEANSTTAVLVPGAGIIAA